MPKKKKGKKAPLGLVPPGKGPPGKEKPALPEQSQMPGLPPITPDLLITMLGAKDVDLNMTRALLQSVQTANHNLAVENARLKDQLKKAEDEVKQLKKETKKK